MELEIKSIQVRGEAVRATLSDGRSVSFNARELLAERIGCPITDDQLAEVLHGLRLSLVPPGELQRALEDLDRATAAVRALAAGSSARAS